MGRAVILLLLVFAAPAAQAQDQAPDAEAEAADDEAELQRLQREVLDLQRRRLELDRGLPDAAPIDRRLVRREQVEAGIQHRGPEVEERIDELLSFAALEKRRDTHINTLSGGMLRRLSLVRALVNDPELAAIQQLTPEFDVLLDDKPAKAAINWINPEFDEKTRKLNIELILRSYPGPKRGGLTCRLPGAIRSRA